VRETFRRAEEAGLEVAIMARTVALVLLHVWLVGTRARDSVRQGAGCHRNAPIHDPCVPVRAHAVASRYAQD
jgi:hypothetical protein